MIGRYVIKALSLLFQESEYLDVRVENIEEFLKPEGIIIFQPECHLIIKRVTMILKKQVIFFQVATVINFTVIIMMELYKKLRILFFILQYASNFGYLALINHHFLYKSVHFFSIFLFQHSDFAINWVVILPD